MDSSSSGNMQIPGYQLKRGLEEQQPESKSNLKRKKERNRILLFCIKDVLAPFFSRCTCSYQQYLKEHWTELGNATEHTALYILARHQAPPGAAVLKHPGTTLPGHKVAEIAS